MSEQIILAEMNVADHKLLTTHLKNKKPKKIVELGVSAGGTTKLILDAMDQESALHSVDINIQFYKDKSKKTGWLAEEYYSPQQHGHWHTHLGKDICECIDEIGPDIDFLVLDTVHSLPGEILSFLAILPYMSENSVLFLHDITLHIQYFLKETRLNGYQRSAYCNGLLFNAIDSPSKFYSDDDIPNSGVIFIDREHVKNNIFSVLNMFCILWNYIPDKKIIIKTREIIAKHYDEKVLNLFDIGFLANLKNRKP